MSPSRDGERHIRAEVFLQPGFQMRRHGLGVPEMGDEVDRDGVFILQKANHFRRMRIRLAFVDEFGRKHAVEDLRGSSFP